MHRYFLKRIWKERVEFFLNEISYSNKYVNIYNCLQMLNSGMKENMNVSLKKKIKLNCKLCYISTQFVVSFKKFNFGLDNKNDSW